MYNALYSTRKLRILSARFIFAVLPDFGGNRMLPADALSLILRRAKTNPEARRDFRSFSRVPRTH